MLATAAPLRAQEMGTSSTDSLVLRALDLEDSKPRDAAVLYRRAFAGRGIGARAARPRACVHESRHGGLAASARAQRDPRRATQWRGALGAVAHADGVAARRGA